MNKQISELIEKIFENVPYSKESENLKNEAEAEFKTEYNEFKECGKNNLQAFGELMSRYGELEAAAGLAGKSKSELEKICSEDNATEKKKFKKAFLKYRIFAIISTWFLCGAVVNIFQGIILRAPNYILSILISFATGFLFMLPCIKQIKIFSYDRIRLSVEAKKLFDTYYDRYIKRAVNSVFLLTALAVYFISLTFERKLLAKLTSMSFLPLSFHTVIFPCWDYGFSLKIFCM